MIILELIRLLLPGPITLDPYTDAAEDHLLASPKVNPQLHNISILHSIQPRRHVRLAQAHVVKKRPRRASNILDMPLAVQVEKLAVFPTHNLRLEPDRGIGGVRWVGHGQAIAF